MVIQWLSCPDILRSSLQRPPAALPPQAEEVKGVWSDGKTDGDINSLPATLEIDINGLRVLRRQIGQRAHMHQYHLPLLGREL